MTRKDLGMLYNTYREEISKSGWMSLLFFLIILSLTVIKPVRNSLFLTEFGAAKLPLVYLATALFSGIFIFFDFKLSQKLNPSAIFSVTLTLLFLNLIGFWWLVHLPQRWIAVAFYIWVNFFNTILITHFWAFVHDFFNPREAKRLFGFILTSGTLGGIVGGIAANFSVKTILNTENVLLISAGALLLSIPIIQWIERKIPRNSLVGSSRVSKNEGKISSLKKIKLPFKHRHLKYLALMISLGVVVSTLIDYQFNSVVDKTYATKSAKTEFFGEFFAILNAVSLFAQLILTRKVLKNLSLALTLFTLPFLLALGTLGFMLFPGILLASILKVADKTLNYSLMQSARELLFLPIPSQLRLQAKLFINVFMNRFAASFAAGLILVVTVIIPIPLEYLGGITLIFLLIWMLITRSLRKEYLNSLKNLLVHRDVDLEERVIQILDSETIQTLLNSLKSRDHLKIRYALSLLELVPSENMLPFLIPLLKHWDAKVRAQVLRILYQIGKEKLLDEIQPLLFDEDIEVRIEAIHFLCEYSRVPTMQKMAEFIADPDPRIKGSALACMINHSNTITPEGLKELEKMLKDTSKMGETQRREAARALGVIQHGFGLHHHLHTLLQDPSLTVQKVAIESVGKVLHPEYIEPLIDKLAHPKLRPCARRALANYGDKVLPELLKIINNPDIPVSIRRSIPRVLYQIQTEKSWQYLNKLLNIKESVIRFEVIKALNKIRKKQPDWTIDKNLVTDVLENEIKYYFNILNIYYAYARREKLSIDVREFNDILNPALREKLEESYERIFRTLALIYSQEEIYNTYYFLIHGNKDEKAHAIEFLDNLLPGQLKVMLLPIIEDISLEHKVRHGRALFGFKKLTRKQAMAVLLDEGDTWLRVCTIYRLMKEEVNDFSEKVNEFLHVKESMLREIARKYFQINMKHLITW